MGLMSQTGLEIDQTSSTRERILLLLASHPHTIDELAKETQVSKNAVRVQIATLTREGLIEVQGMLKGPRRPAAVFSLSPGSDLYFSKAYPAVLAHLIHVLAGKLSHEEFMAVMQELGKRLAGSAAGSGGNPRERIQAAFNFLKGLGPFGQMTEENGNVVITNPVCPISRAVAADARACTAIETLLRESTGLPVEEHCSRGKRQSCRFTIKVPREDKSPLAPRRKKNSS